MKPELRFEVNAFMAASLGEKSSVPDIVGSLVLQNDLEFDLDETDEIYEAYGRRTNSYPYRQYNTYNRKLSTKEMKTAVLENDYLYAVFLPELGGRLWELTDKKTGRNLLYTNDVIRFSNLAVRNAWFSGGVEWNVGIIGHTPFTTEALHTARLTDDAGNPVLRMYEYERIRGVEYQMDFWLGADDTYLNCRMRIVNSGNKVVPMYWWSNMAVPEYEGGRLVVPAKEAFTSKDGQVYKVPVPMVNGVDVTRYGQLPEQVDYFFHVPDKEVKFISNLDGQGYGLLQMSTQRLKGRKLFSWGHNDASSRWQEFLTENAGKYVEIQAGLGKTQYGCIPMAPHSAWEWMEQYGPYKSELDVESASYEDLRHNVAGYVEGRLTESKLEEVLKETRVMAKTKGELIYSGSRYGAFAQEVRKRKGEKLLSSHLDYGTCTKEQESLIDFLENGSFPEKMPDEIPGEFLCEKVFYDRLLETIDGENQNNWNAHYHLGLLCLYEGHQESAVQEFLLSASLSDNPWNHHALAAAAILEGKKEDAKKHMMEGLKQRESDLSYVKEAFRIFMMAEGYEEIEKMYGQLPEIIQENDRITYSYLRALLSTGRGRQVYSYLEEHPEFLLEDLREGEDSLGQLWCDAYEAVHGRKPEAIPHQWNFNSLLCAPIECEH